MAARRKSLLSPISGVKNIACQVSYGLGPEDPQGEFAVSIRQVATTQRASGYFNSVKVTMSIP